jgi:hypothetical protein
MKNYFLRKKIFMKIFFRKKKFSEKFSYKLFSAPIGACSAGGVTTTNVGLPSAERS